MAEAYVGLGDEENSAQKLEEANSFSPADWMVSTTERRLTALRSLLEKSPLKSLGQE